MTTFRSTEKRIKARARDVYEFISDINNFDNLVPSERVRDFESDQESCRFTIDGVGRVGVRIAEKHPVSYIVYESEGSAPFPFKLRVDLEEAGEKETLMKIELNAKLNMMMKMLAKRPLAEGTETAASRLADHLNQPRQA